MEDILEQLRQIETKLNMLGEDKYHLMMITEPKHAYHLLCKHFYDGQYCVFNMTTKNFNDMKFFNEEQKMLSHYFGPWEVLERRVKLVFAKLIREDKDGYYIASLNGEMFNMGCGPSIPVPFAYLEKQTGNVYPILHHDCSIKLEDIYRMYDKIIRKESINTKEYIPTEKWSLFVPENCVVCLEKPATHTNLSCNVMHMIACKDCSPKLNDCIYCHHQLDQLTEVKILIKDEPIVDESVTI